MRTIEGFGRRWIRDKKKKVRWPAYWSLRGVLLFCFFPSGPRFWRCFLAASTTSSSSSHIKTLWLFSYRVLWNPRRREREEGRGKKASERADAGSESRAGKGVKLASVCVCICKRRKRKEKKVDVAFTLLIFSVSRRPSPNQRRQREAEKGGKKLLSSSLLLFVFSLPPSFVRALFNSLSSLLLLSTSSSSFSCLKKKREGEGGGQFVRSLSLSCSYSIPPTENLTASAPISSHRRPLLSLWTRNGTTTHRSVAHSSSMSVAHSTAQHTPLSYFSTLFAELFYTYIFASGPFSLFFLFFSFLFLFLYQLDATPLQPPKSNNNPLFSPPPLPPFFSSPSRSLSFFLSLGRPVWNVQSDINYYFGLVTCTIV